MSLDKFRRYETAPCPMDGSDEETSASASDAEGRDVFGAVVKCTWCGIWCVSFSVWRVNGSRLLPRDS